jgi:pimeloyl-ACP methyl ester carboxylesterase
MTNLEILQKLAILSMGEIETQLTENPESLHLEQLVGSEQAGQLEISARAPKARGPREAVVLLPGIMGSLLLSLRGVTTLLWINPLLFLNGQGNFLRVGPGGDSLGAPEVECAAFSLEKLTYLKMVLELRRSYAVYEFPYDWRLPIEVNAGVLHQSIEHWSAGNPAQQFTLIAHSMGGLVSRAYLGRHPREGEQRIKRLITLGTPHLGATSAIDNLFNGNQMMAVVDKLNEQNGMRDVVLSMPSIYQLLPAPNELLPAGVLPAADWDLYNAGAWKVDGLRQEYLDMAKSLHQFLAAHDPQVDLVQIAGCNIATATQATLTDSNGQKKLSMVSFEEGAQSGDGTVPGWSGFYEKARLFYIQEVHRDLPKNNQVIQAVQDLIQSDTCDLNKRIPRRKVGLFARAPITSPATQAAVLEDKIRAGSVDDADLDTLYFAS